MGVVAVMVGLHGGGLARGECNLTYGFLHSIRYWHE